MALIPSNLNFPTKSQVPEHSILDYYNKQCYSGNSFIVPIAAKSLADTSETVVLLIKNPATSAKSIFYYLRRVSAGANYCLFKYYLNPTISAVGSGIATPVNLRTACSTVSVSLCYTAPTISANGTLLSALGAPAGLATVADSSVLIILDPGQNLLVTATAAGAAVINSDNSFYEI